MARGIARLNDVARAPRGAERAASRLLSAGASVVASSVLVDSAMEHYRGSFRDPAMVLPIALSAGSLLLNGRETLAPAGPSTLARMVHVTAGAVGSAGLAFHAWNVGKQAGGFRLVNLFYRAPLGAPATLLLTGLIGTMAERLADPAAPRFAAFLRAPRVVGTVAAMGLAGTVAEAGLLHFRGAYHDPAMWLPVSLPPLATLSLLRDVLTLAPRRMTYGLLGATAAMGVIGMAFHAYGVARNMGGWRNWRQNLLAGPPLPAPPSFSGLAVAGIAALRLLKDMRRG
nr:hypothetical protein [Novosphingobium profundi]